MYTFEIHDGDFRSATSPELLAGDITKLEELFPGHKVWNSRKSFIGNQYYLTVKEAEAFLRSLQKHHERYGVSDELYSASTMYPHLKSNLKFVFDSLIPFFQTELEKVT